MRIASLILPLFDNAGDSLAELHSDVRRDLAEAFGGFTAQEVTGAWRDDASGVLFEDSAIRYDVAADWRPALLGMFADIAESYRQAARQLALCVILPDEVAQHMTLLAPATFDDESPRERDKRKATQRRERAAHRARKFAARDAWFDERAA